MPGAGDLVTVLSLEDFEFRTGLRNASTETRRFASDVTRAGQSASAGFGRNIGQMGFALQDFSSILEMGGKNALGRAIMSTMNNVQMLGASFGPWGLAISSVAGALGSILIPKLLEGASAFDYIREATEKSTEALSGYIKRGQDLMAFQDKLGTQQGGAAKTAGQLDLEEKQKRFEVDAIAKQIQEVDRQIANVKAAGQGAKQGGGLIDMLPGSLLSEALGGPKFSEIVGMGVNKFEGIDATIKQLQAVREKLIAQQAGAAAEVGAVLNKRGALQEAAPQIEQRGFADDFQKQYEHDLDEIEKIRQKNLTPMQRMTEGLTGLADLSRAMPGNEGILAGGMDQLFAEFEKSLPRQQHARLAGAAQFGSSEAISVVNRAVAQSNAGDERKQQIAEAKRQVDLAKQQLEELKRIRENQNQVAPVQLAGD